MAIARTRVAADKKTGATTPPGILALAALVDEKAIVVTSDQHRDAPSAEANLRPLGDNYLQIDVPEQMLSKSSQDWPRRISPGAIVFVQQGAFDLDLVQSDGEVLSPGVVRYTSATSSAKS
jgi:hypothetical protein